MSLILLSATEEKEDRFNDDLELLTDLEIDDDDQDEEEEDEQDEEEKARENEELAKTAHRLGFYKVARKLRGEYDEEEDEEKDDENDDDSPAALWPSARGMGAVHRTLRSMGYAYESE